MNISNRYSLTALLAVIVYTSQSQADWYMGIDEVPASDWYEIEDYSIDTTSSDFVSKLSEPGLKLFSGFKAHELFTIEFEYKDQMEFGVGNVFSGKELWLTGDHNLDHESKTLFFSGSSTFVIDEKARINFRGGLYNWDLKPNNSQLEDNFDRDRSGTDLFYSVSSYFDVTEKIGFSAEWERFEFQDEDVDFVSTELHFNF